MAQPQEYTDEINKLLQVIASLQAEVQTPQTQPSEDLLRVIADVLPKLLDIGLNANCTRYDEVHSNKHQTS